MSRPQSLLPQGSPQKSSSINNIKNSTRTASQATSQSRDRLSVGDGECDESSSLLPRRSGNGRLEGISAAEVASSKQPAETVALPKLPGCSIVIVVTVLLTILLIVSCAYTGVMRAHKRYRIRNRNPHYASYPNAYFHPNFRTESSSSSSSTAFSNGETNNHFSNSNNNESISNDDFYDYIVVGAGPSGIITAVTLARTLPSLRILLVEAGTASQASVLSNMMKQKDERRQRPTNENGGNRSSSTSDCGTARTATEGTATQSGDDDAHAGLTEFDVPLLWSAVASSGAPPLPPSNAKVVRSSSSNLHGSTGFAFPQQKNPLLQQQQQSHHHWPIGRTLLGKTIGGSGIHNAMIYIRSLSSDWKRWNITGWDFERHILPEYVRLERYCQATTEDCIGSDNFAYNGREAKTTTLDSILTTPVDTQRMDAVAPLFVQSAIQAGFPSKIGQGFNYRRSRDANSQHDRDETERDAQERIGVGYYEFNIRNGIRDSVAHAFLGRPDGLPVNLVIESGATVTRVLWAPQADNKDSHEQSSHASNNKYVENDLDMQGQHSLSSLPRATGVEYVRTATSSGSSDAIHQRGRVGQFLLREWNVESCKGEVILAAGAVLSPQLLVNSGIGDSGDANDSIKSSLSGTSTQWVHLPGVGKNLQDHPVVTIGFEISAELALMGGVSSIYTVGNEMDEYFWSVMELQRRNGLKDRNQPSATATELDDLTMLLGTIGTPGFSAGGFLRSPFADDNDHSPDIQLTIFPRHLEPHMARQTQQGSRDITRMLRNKAMLVTVALLNPEAHFEVKASQSSIPLVQIDNYHCVDEENEETLHRINSYRLPEINLAKGRKHYLTDRDVQRLAWGLEQVRQIQSTAPLADHTGPELYPGGKVRGTELLDYVRENSLPNAHWAGSTRMRRSSSASSSMLQYNSEDDDDEMAVVDDRLSVRKVRNLRIVDAGVLPGVPNGNIHSTVCVVASRAAAMIAEDRRVREQRTV